jgi:hypothetical protein
MKEDNTKEIFSDKLVIADMQYEIKRMDAELEYHKTKVTIFDQAIQSKQTELNEMLNVSQIAIPKGEMYK